MREISFRGILSPFGGERELFPFGAGTGCAQRLHGFDFALRPRVFVVKSNDMACSSIG